LAALLMLGGTARSAGTADRIVFVVNAASPLTHLRREEARAYYLGERIQLPSGEHVTLTMRPSGSIEKEAFLRLVVETDERDCRQRWMARAYRGDSASPPLVLDSDVAVIRYVTRTKSAIGYLS